MTIGTQALSDAGVSIWLDDLSRERLVSGNLSDLIESHHVVGVTTNPAIFSAALSTDSTYDSAIAACQQEDLDAATTITRITTDDVRQACDLFLPVFESSGGINGRVSIEVEPDLAHDTAGTVARAQELWQIVDRPNAMIKIPATSAGLPAITATIAQGISVNVTLIFSLQRYREVINAYLTGLEQARSAGLDITKIHSVASFFVSRLDSAVDPHFDASDDPETRRLIGSVAIANAAAAYEIFEQQFATVRARYLLEHGANEQRLLWASTGVKDKRFPADLYVTELVAPNTVNTMPEATLRAAADLESVDPEALFARQRTAVHTLAHLPAVGLSYDAVTDALEREGLEKFATAWNELVQSVTDRLESVA